MAATTLATMLDTIRDSVMRGLIWEFFVKADPVFAQTPAVRWSGGYRKLFDYVATSDAASAVGAYGTFSASAFTKAQYQTFLNLVYKMDQRNTMISSMGEGQQGMSDRLTKQIEIIRELSKLAREYLIVGEPSQNAAGTAFGTGDIGATLQALIGASGVIEVSPRTFDFDDVHPQNAVVSTTLGKFKWTNASASLQYKAPGDDYYGPAQVIATDNWYRVPLFSGADASNNPNPTKWARVTCEPVATILAAGNYESDTTAAKGLTLTPSLQPTGWYRQVSPVQQIFADLTGAAAEAGTTATGNGPQNGGLLNLENMTWLKQRLLDASNEDPSRCAILMNDNQMIRAQGVLTAAGSGINPVAFMGTELNTLNFGGIPIIRNNFLPNTLADRANTRTDLTVMLGVCMGEEDCHYQWTAPSNDDITAGELSGVLSGALAEGDKTPTGTQIPVNYYETKNASNTLVVNQIGLMGFEPQAKLQSLSMVTELLPA